MQNCKAFMLVDSLGTLFGHARPVADVLFALLYEKENSHLIAHAFGEHSSSAWG